MAKSIIPSRWERVLWDENSFSSMNYATKEESRARKLDEQTELLTKGSWSSGHFRHTSENQPTTVVLDAESPSKEIWIMRSSLRDDHRREPNGAGRMEQKKMENLSETSAKKEEMRWWFRQNDDGGRSAKTNNLIHSNLPMVKWCATMWKCLLFLFCCAVLFCCIRDIHLWLFWLVSFLLARADSMLIFPIIYKKN